MKFSKVKHNPMGSLYIRGLMEDGTILMVSRERGKLGYWKNSYCIDGVRVKSTGASNKQFGKYFDQFSKLLEKLI